MTVVAVTGAGGRLGRHVARRLRDRADGVGVVLTTRRPEALADVAAEGVQVRRADFDDPASLQAALAGVDRLLVISTDVVGERVRQHRDAFAAAARAGVQHVVYTSMLHPTPDHPSAPLSRDHRASEEALRGDGLAWSILRYGFFTEALVGTCERAIASGRLVSNAGAGRAAWVSVADCADAAVCVLLDGGRHGETIDIAGAEAVSYADVAQLAGELGGHAVELVDVDDATYRDGLLQRGVGEADADEYTSFGRAIREGFATGESAPLVAITGRAPRSVRDVLVAHGVGGGR